jgi:DNA-binding ferritin-like protein
MKSTKEIKERIIAAGYEAVEQLIKVAKEDIIKPNADDELAADKLKNAAATKKLAIFDAFEILSRIESEKENLDTSNSGPNKIDSIQGFAERRSK